MRRKIWKIKDRNPQAETLAQKYGISPFLAQLLLNRDIAENEFNTFLNPTLDCLHSPYLLPDIFKAKERLCWAISKKERVLIFGDYDVDGITALTIFNEFAKNFPGIFSFYLPHRLKEGYGLNKEVIGKAKAKGLKLIITFDCGTNAYEEVALAKEFAIDIIVIDHHYPQGEIEPFAFINPKRKDSLYPFSDLSTAALSFKFIQTLTGNCCYGVLDLVVLSLICDVVPLRGENRILLQEGIKTIKKSMRPAIKALCKVAGTKQENIDIFHIGFILGPRINASGRVAHPQDSFRLFLTEDQEEADNLAFKLSEYNRLRKDIESQILREAEEIIGDDLADKSAIVVSGENWHPGVLGIVASRLVDKYYRPSFVISFNKDIGKGSARSIHSVHLMEVLDRCSDSLLIYGGHRKAAGVKLAKADLDIFKEKVNTFLAENLSAEDFVPVFDIDARINFSDINMGLIEELEKLKPYGEANPEALFISKNIFKKSPLKKIRSGFSVWLSDTRRTFEGIVYDRDILEIINYADNFDILFSIERNSYHNIPKLIIKDCRII